MELAEERGPARDRAQLLALLEHQAPELLDAELLHQELDARARAVLLLAEPREHAAHRLRQRQELLFGHELVEQLRRVRHRAEPAADVELEAAFGLPSTCTRSRDRAEVVEVGEPAGIVLAAREARS